MTARALDDALDTIGLAYPWSESELLSMTNGRLSRLWLRAVDHLGRIYAR